MNKINAKCVQCGIENSILLRSYKLSIKINGMYYCLNCKMHQSSQKISTASKKAWQNPERREQMRKITAERHRRGGIDLTNFKATNSDPNKHNKIADTISKMWEAGHYKNAHWGASDPKKIAEGVSRSMTPERRKKYSEQAKNLWKDEAWRARHALAQAEAVNKPEIKKKLSEAAKKRWQNPEYRAKISASLANRDDSVLERIVNKILRDLKYNPYKLTHGGWTFDVAVEIPGRKGILLEIQGEFVHDLPGVKNRDKLKYNYYLEHLSNLYDLHYLNEHDFYALGKIRQKLGRLFNIVRNVNDFNLTSVVVSRDQEAFKFLSAYHYLDTKRGGIPIVAKINDTIIAACVFSPPIRLESAKRLKIAHKELVELSRFCIDPSYQIHNLGSWFISRAISLLKSMLPNVKMIITWADSTMDHTGTLYKASGFIEDGFAPPTYWYIDQSECWLHKKSVWNQASRNKMTEKQYAEKHHLIKISGQKLLRFIYRIK